MKKKYCDVGQHECDKLFHARTKERLSSCAIHAPRTPIKVKKGNVVEYNAKDIHGNPYRATGRILSVIPTAKKNKASQKPKKRWEEQSTSELKKLAQIVVNRHVKKIYTQYDKTAQCFTCTRWFPAREMDASHFISVKHQSTRYDMDNIRLCCVSCNRLLHGNLKLYKEALIQDIGKDQVDALYVRSVEIKRWTKQELLELIEKYK